MRASKLIVLGLVLAAAFSGAVRAEEPKYVTQVIIDGIFGGGADGRIQEVVQMLKDGEQKILDVEILARNGYGKILRAAVHHSPTFPVNTAVLEEMKALRVSIDGIWGGNSTDRIRQQVATLKAAEQKIVRIEVTGYNGYGKILSANIWHISKYKYETLIAQPTP